jgi:sulfate adenylyltransferase
MQQTEAAADQGAGELFLPDREAEAFKAHSRDLHSIDLPQRELCDLELLMNGGFAPLRGFLGRKDYAGILGGMRLADGAFWPMPVTLGITPRQAEALSTGQRVALRDDEGDLLAGITVTDLWEPDLREEAQAVFGTLDPAHPGVRPLLETERTVYVGGEVQGLKPPIHSDFKQFRFTPTELRREFARRGWRHVVGFQTRNPLHRAHKEMMVRAATEIGAHLLLHPSVGMTKPGDIDHFIRVRCYQAILQHFPPDLVMLGLLNLAMRMGGPREALWHALIRKNHGCTHFIVGRDHAGPGIDGDGKPFYGPYEAQELVARHEHELGIRMVPFQEMVYVSNRAQYLPVNELEPADRVENISGTEQRRRLREGLEIPAWFSYPEVIEELRKSFPPRDKVGFTLFFTGLSGAGKSTIARILLAKFMEMGQRPVTLLDGDIVRKNLSSELGFSREHRDLNILRIGFVANEITKNGGIAICAPIAPYTATRRQVRELISAHGSFIEIFVATPLAVCEERDRKGLYAKARAGLIQQFTGISDPYEEPERPEMRLETVGVSAEEAAQEVILYLEHEGYLT